jgi:2-(1,2-epoxy-1,2-dihydrophenyl)acetyl-CoA isomerase
MAGQGPFNKVVADAEPEKMSMDIVFQFAKEPTVSYTIVKENLNNAMFSLLERQFELERRGMILAGSTMDAREGITAFLEKRRSNFIGR